MIIIIEDLPEPEGPTTLTVSPGSTIRSRPRRMWTGPAAEGRVSSTDSSAIMALEAGRDVVRASRCLEVMAHVGFSALNAYGPDGGDRKSTRLNSSNQCETRMASYSWKNKHKQQTA